MGPAFPSTRTVSLRELELLVVDCQTTGASPQKGHLLELAWCHTSAARAAGELELCSTLVAQPGQGKVPRRITRLTGISGEDLQGAPAPRAVWHQLAAAASLVAARAGATRAPAVAHFARFERSFLEALCDASGGSFALDLICTHEIACRVLPGLPRRGLRALAGYFGLVLDEHKRATAHVQATVLVWSRLVELLESQWGVGSLWELGLWLDEVKPAREGGRDYPLARERRLSLVQSPGVYQMLGKGGEVLYLGKATSLKSRVNSYFQRPKHDNQRTMEMLTQAHDVAVFPTCTSLEAALLEADEIKRLAPPYNVALRADDHEVWYGSDDLTSLQARPDPAHPLGPVPARRSLEAVGRLAALLAGTRPAQIMDNAAAVLGLPASMEPCADCFAKGLQLFGQRHGRQLRAGLGAPELARLGVGLWRRRQRLEPEPETADPPPSRPPGERGWDAPRVAEALEQTILWSAQLLRRAHWLCQLSEASLVWEASGGMWRQLIIQQGQVTQREDLDLASLPEPPPAPPGHARTMAQRRRVFDRVVHDRLRVLTTELRRLVARDARPRLRLGPSVVLNQRALVRRLWWF